MSRLDYSKWDNIELSDDEDVECHPNIDKASWVRWRQQDIHRKRDERKLEIAKMQQEHKTNEELRKRLLDSIKWFTASGPEGAVKHASELLDRVVRFENDRKDVVLNPESSEYLQLKDEDEIYDMLIARLISESKVDPAVQAYIENLPRILVNELPRLEKRQQELLDNIAKEEKEQNKKLTSENICREGFNKTILNGKTTHDRGTKSESKQVEVLNPGFESAAGKKATTASKKTTDEIDLRDLEDGEEEIMLKFAAAKTFEESFTIIQKHPNLASRAYSDHLMARAFSLQMKGKTDDAFKCAKWSTAISYSLQMGPDGVGLFYKRMIQGGPQVHALFDEDLARQFDHIKKRCEILKGKEKQLDEENSNLTPEQAAVFQTFPKHFQEALLANDINKINEAFDGMSEEQSKEIMEQCQKTGLISVLSEDEVQKLKEEEPEAFQVDE